MATAEEQLSGDELESVPGAMKAPDDEPPQLQAATSSAALLTLKALRETLTRAHGQILQKLDQEIRLLEMAATSETVIEESAASLESLPAPSEVVEPPRPPGQPSRRSVTLQDQAPSPEERASHRRTRTTDDRSPLTFKNLPAIGLQDSIPEECHGLDGVIPAPRARTDPKTFLPSLSKKQKNRNYFRQQSMAVLQDLAKSPGLDAKSSPLKSSGNEADLPRTPEKDSAVEGERVMAWRQEDQGLFGGMRTHFSIESVQMRALSGMEVQEKADNRCTKIVSHPYFDRFMMLLVVLNCIEMAVSVEFDRDRDSNTTALHTALMVSGNFFCTMFMAEIVLRWFSYARKTSALQDGWFLFDLALVLLMVWETWAMPFVLSGHNDVSGAWRMARILRVLRTARMARLVRLMPELMILIKGMIVACRSVFFTLVLLLIITFIFSIAFLELSSNTQLEDEYFPSIPDAIVSLILHCIVPDQEVFFRSLAQENWILGVLVLLFILLGSLTVMNMLLGVLVEAVKTVSTIEQEQMMADFARKVLWRLIQGQSTEEVDYHNRMISEKEFRSLLRKPRAMKALQKLGVDPSAALDYGRMLFEDDEAVSFVDFMHAMLTLRGSNKTTVKDIVELRKFVGEEFNQLRSVLSELCAFIGDTMWMSNASADRFSIRDTS